MVNLGSTRWSAQLAPIPGVVTGPRGPSASLVNKVAVAAGIEITLLSYVITDDELRVQAAVRVGGQHEPVLASVPVLELTQLGDAAPLRSRGGHVLPAMPIVWVAWMFALPLAETHVMSGCVERIELGYRSGRKTESVVGPWLFETLPGLSGACELAARRPVLEA